MVDRACNCISSISWTSALIPVTTWTERVPMMLIFHSTGWIILDNFCQFHKFPPDTFSLSLSVFWNLCFRCDSNSNQTSSVAILHLAALFHTITEDSTPIFLPVPILPSRNTNSLYLDEAAIQCTSSNLVYSFNVHNVIFSDWSNKVNFFLLCGKSALNWASNWTLILTL